MELGKAPREAKKPQSDRGIDLERQARRACDLYARQKRAHVRKLLTSAVAERHQAASLDDEPTPGFRYAGHGWPDFEGYLAHGARAVLFDTKATKYDALPCDRITEQQARRLRNLASCGGLAGLVIRLGEGTPTEAHWWVDWSAVERHGLRGSLTRAWLEENGRGLIQVRVTNGLALLWLEGALGVTTDRDLLEAGLAYYQEETEKLRDEIRRLGGAA